MITIENLTRKHSLVTEGRIANNVWTRFCGLMGVGQLPVSGGLLIDPCDNVHTHFMRIPIDVIYVDSTHRVVHIDAEMKPWRIGRRQRTARYVIEVRSGRAEQTGTQIGDQLAINR